MSDKTEDRTVEEVTELLTRCYVIEQEATADNEDMVYNQGIIAAIEWMHGNDKYPLDYKT